MLESLINRFLTKYLEAYLVDFDTKSFSVGFFSGMIELRNLHLNHHILDHIPMPLVLKYGRIGSI